MLQQIACHMRSHSVTLLSFDIKNRNVVHVQWMIKICQYESEWSMRCRKFLSESEVGPIESCRLCPWIAESSVVMPEMVEEEDNVGRGGCC